MVYNKIRSLLFPLIVLFPINAGISQSLLDADGAGNTYELINSVLAPGYDAIEVPDCKHTTFGRHIDEVWDNDLGDFVFRFHMHKIDDDDRCINSDRQRNEIKTYDKSPDTLKGVQGELVEYTWKFKLDAGFQSSPSFTHIHQLKAVGGTESSMPLITLTTRKGTPDRLELRYAETTSQTTLAQVDLAPFKDTWVEVTETVLYNESGRYSIEISKVSDGTSLFSYTNNSIRMWKTNADFIRPKWGIYRSLNSPTDLRDEIVDFANFSIHELDTNLPVELTDYYINEKEKTVSINWEVAFELNSDYFEIQHSTKNSDWNVLGKIKTEKISLIPKKYQFTHNTPLPGINYYRIKQVDLDGTYLFFPTLAWKNKKTNAFILSPNPVENSIRIENEFNPSAFYQIMDQNGKILKEGNLDNNNSIINIHELNVGIYWISINGNPKKFIKIK